MRVRYLAGEFLSTVEEWHYFVSGISVGVVLGVYMTLRWTAPQEEGDGE